MLARALLDPTCYPHPVGAVELHETHISWVFLAGPYAYKVKKPVSLGFLDFSTLEARRRYCEEELALNRRFAPGLYLEVVEIRSTPDGPRVGGSGGPLAEYAVKMRRFPQEALASRLLERGALTPKLVTDFAHYLARFHSSLPPAGCHMPFGTTESVLRNVLQNFEQIAPLLDRDHDRKDLAELRDWTEHEFLARYGELRERRAKGMVREGHGDLHLRNIVFLDGTLVPFDCIEFSAELRWNDVVSEVAFLAMDLMDQGAADLAWVFINAWLEASGDYAGLAVLRFYLVYRAMVRAKVHLMRAREPGVAPQDFVRLTCAYRHYVALARRCAASQKPALVLMHGFSGSGKSALAAALAPALGAIRIRSDVERKRLQGLPSLAGSGSGLATGLYGPAMTLATYERLAATARAVVSAGYPAIVDAAFLERSQRMPFMRTAQYLGVPVVFVETRAPTTMLRERIAQRTGDASEATLDVLEHQIASAQPIAPPELSPVLVVDTARHDVTHLAPDVAARLRETFSGPSLIQVNTHARSAPHHDYRVDATQFV